VVATTAVAWLNHFSYRLSIFAMGNAVLLYSAIQGKMLKKFITRVSSRLIVAIYCYAVILIAV